MNENIILSHNDMDGVACELVLGTKFNFETILHSSYINIVEKLKLIDEIITVHSSTVFITDLMFDEEAFIELVRLAMNHPHVNFIYIDHHDYIGPELELLGKINNMDNVFVKHDTSKCATKLCYDFIKSTDKDLDRFVRFVNAYDIYLEELPEFKIGYILNTVFWAIKASAFKSIMRSNDFKFPKNFLKINNEIVEKKNKKFKSLEEQGLIVKDYDNQILLAFSDTYKSDYVHDYEGFKAYILPYESNNNISVRFRDFEYAEEAKHDILEMMDTYPKLVSAGGHPFAFGITIEKSAPRDEIFMLIEAIIEIISSYTNPQGALNSNGVPEIDINEDEIPF